jgi:hypothetical protein
MPSPGVTTLSTLTANAMDRADMVNSNYISASQWTNYINASIQELYDLLTSKYEFYYMKVPAYQFTTDGTSQFYSMPTDFYKLYGVDLILFPNAGNNPISFITLKNFPFAERNKYAIPNYQTYFGVTNLQYCLTQTTPAQLMFIPIPAGGQVIQIWYCPRFTPLVNGTDTFDGINGYEEYVIIDAAIKARIKEESDVQELLMAKAAMVARIESIAANRDAGAPSRIVDVNSSNFGWPSVPNGGTTGSY